MKPVGDHGMRGGAVDLHALPSAQEFAAYVGTLRQLAAEYGRGDPNTLVLDYLRHEDYANYQWRKLLGELDHGFIALVQRAWVEPMWAFRDPVFDVPVKTSHLGAACAGVYEHGRTPGVRCDRGDITGWGGDWITFFGDWRREHRSHASGADFCLEVLARPDRVSTFMLEDLAEDADAYNIGMRIFEGADILDAVRCEYPAARPLPRLGLFFQGRFGDEATARTAASHVLLSHDDKLVTLGRAYLVETIGGVPSLLPRMMPAAAVEQFCQGFVDVLLRLVA